MRYPDKARVPFRVRVYDALTRNSRMWRIPTSKIATVVTVVAVGGAFWMMAIQPVISHDYYAEKQRQRWERMNTTREELAHGLPVWRDPFDRPDRKTPPYAK